MMEMKKVKVRYPESLENEIVEQMISEKGFVSVADINLHLTSVLFEMLDNDELDVNRTEMKQPTKDKQINVPIETYKALKNTAFKNGLPEIQTTLSLFSGNYTKK